MLQVLKTKFKVRNLFQLLQKRRMPILGGFALLTYLLIYFTPLLYLAILEGLEADYYDFRFRLRGAEKPNPDIVLVAVDDLSLEDAEFSDEVYEYEDYVLTLMGTDWPWDREVFARALDKIVSKGGAKGVLFDLLFMSKQSPEGDQLFKDTIQAHKDKVVLVSKVDYSFAGSGSQNDAGRIRMVEPNESILEEGHDTLTGLANVMNDTDDKIRRAYYTDQKLQIRVSNDPGAVVDYEKLYALPDDIWSISAIAAKKFVEGTRIPSRHEELYINYAGPKYTYPVVSFRDLFLPDRWEGGIIQGGDFFKDKLVIIGSYAEIHKDFRTTPFAVMPGPELQANQLATLLESDYIEKLSLSQNRALSLFIFALCLLGCLRFKHAVNKVMLLFGVSVAYILITQLLFNTYHLSFPITCLAVGVLIVGNFALFYDFIIEQYERMRIRGMFGTYVSPEVVNEMIESGDEPQLGGEEEEITCFFSDVQSFSSFSELLSPKQLVDLMNEYLTAMTDILHEEGGTLDKYIGDAIVAMFGAPIKRPKHAALACRAAVRMQDRQAELRKKWESEGQKWPVICHLMRTRIGLNSGLATVGNMGSATRFNYTFMGDNVNLAARCESGAKSYGVYSMVTESTVEAAQKDDPELLFRFLDKIVVKGRTKPVKVYELMGLKGELGSEYHATLENWNKGVEAYLKRDWDKAMDSFRLAEKTEPHHPSRAPGSPTTPSKLMLERCLHYKRSDPGEQWDGVFVMKSK